MISIVIVTCNRRELLRQTIENVVARTSPLTRQVIVWNNASDDGTAEYLDRLEDSRLTIIHSDTNVGLNAYRPAFERATQDYFIELDDDVIDAPQDWDRTLQQAYDRIASDDYGYLAADVIDDGKSRAAEIRYRRDAHKYRPAQIHGVNLLLGPAGGWCTMVSRAIDERVGGHKQNPKLIYFSQDALYHRALRKEGIKHAVLADLKVFHASGPAYCDDSEILALKESFYKGYRKKRARKEAVKRVLHRVPGMPALNRKLSLYRPPQSRA